MSEVRIYQPTKTATQSGRAKNKHWIIEYHPSKKIPDQLMGWVGCDDTKSQIKLSFKSKEEALKYAKAKGLSYVIEEPQKQTIKAKSYAANYSPRRVF